MPAVCYRPASSNLTVIADSSRSPEQTGRPQINSNISGISLRLSVSDHGIPAIMAYAHHDNSRNVPDKWSMKLSRFHPVFHMMKNNIFYCFRLVKCHGI